MLPLRVFRERNEIECEKTASKIQELIWKCRELSEIIRTEIKDPRVNGAMTSVVAVEVTPDLKYCKAYISVLGDEERAKDALTGLKSAVGYIRRELAHRVNLRNTPEITFVLDQSIEYGVNMSRLIDEVTRDLKD